MFLRTMASVLALTGVAYAQTGEGETPATPTPTSSSSADRVVYEAAFFAQYNPQTALDMVRQTPGFSLDGGEDRRGFSGAVGNLLVDGLRPSTKSQSLEGILSRIPANQVVRIEVLRGAAVAGDASGQSQLLNIVRTPTAGSGVWEAGFELTSRGVPAPRGEISYSGRSGQVEYGVGASIFSQYRDLPGWRQFYDEPGDIYTGRADTPSPRDFREAFINGNIAFPLFGGRVSATSQLGWFRFHADNDYFFFDENEVPERALIQEFEEWRPVPTYEVGLNYDRDIGPWSLSLIGLINRRTYESEEVDLFLDGAGVQTGDFFQNVYQEAGETIARGSLARALGERHRIEFGGEGAFNTLEQELELSGSEAPNVPFANVLVEEERAEFFGSHTWRPADAWSVETRVAWETSTLTFSGDTDQTTELSFWKPSIQVSRTFAGNNQLRFRYYRDVGQLDFGDFVSNASTADAIIAGGNPNLQPQTDWRAELGADLRYNGMALSLTLTHHQIEDVNDVVPLTATSDNGTPGDTSDDFDFTFDAPGNLGEGEAWSLDANFSSPISFIPGGRITVRGSLWDTEVTDPSTSQTRIFSFQPESEVEISFRQDVNAWRFSWGVEIEKVGESQAYRFNEIDTSEEGPWVDFWVETTALPYNTRLRLWAANALDGRVNRDRRFYNQDANPDPNIFDPLGRNGVNTSRDLRERQFAQAPWFIVELSGTF